ncbi:MAG TPA: sigma-70 family RNA polymerase sigma factor [Methylomirabilota bacterium]|nr:sigma-70 family RNA polymerase sigma factor [Methylomirabilota bacterium]
MTNEELLQLWKAGAEESAFEELVRKNLPMVYGAALRQVRRPDLAQDVTQAVFLILHRKAGNLSERTVVSGWLLQTTRHIASRAMRGEMRREHWERESSYMKDLSDMPGESDLQAEMGSHLDSALASLRQNDRLVLVARFFEGLPIRSVAERLGVSEDAAKKRLSRAIDRLRAALGKRGVVAPVTALASALAQSNASPVPADFVNTIIKSAGGSRSLRVEELVESGVHAPPHAGPIALLQIAAVTALLITLVVFFTTYRASHSAMGSTPPVITQAPAKQAQSSAFSAAQHTAPTESLIALRVVSKLNHRPLHAKVSLATWKGRHLINRTFHETDINGMVRLPVRRDPTRQLGITVYEPSHVPVVSQWWGYEFTRPLISHEIVLEPGRKLKGAVFDEHGNAVQGAQITLNTPGIKGSERENIAYQHHLGSVVTSENGSFETAQLPQRLPEEFTYNVTHPDFAHRSRIRLSEGSLLTNQQVVLTRGVKLRGVVIDPDGVPVAHASITEEHNYAGPHSSATSDALGAFEIGPFTKRPIQLVADADGYDQAFQLVQADENTTNVVLRLRPLSDKKSEWQAGMDAAVTFQLSGTVVDAQTGQPVPSFEVLLNKHSGTDLKLLGQGYQGDFDWPIVMAFFHKFSLQVRAEGYEPATTDARAVKEAKAHFNVSLQRRTRIAGRVLDTTGAPLARAFVGLNGLNYGSQLLQGCKPSAPNSPVATTDAEGYFSFAPQQNAESVLIVGDTGTALVPINELENGPVRLAAWASVRGVLLVGGKPLAGETVALAEAIPLDDSSPDFTKVQAVCTTDSHGRFEFPKIPAGPITLARHITSRGTRTRAVGRSHWTQIVAEPGATVEVVLSGAGRLLKGRLERSKHVDGYTWGNDLPFLVREGAPKADAAMQPGTVHWRAFSRAMRRFEAAGGKHPVIVQADGSFVIEDVPAGEYKFELTLTREAVDRLNNIHRMPIGKASMRVTVPEGQSAEAVDLGLLRAEIN